MTGLLSVGRLSRILPVSDYTDIFKQMNTLSLWQIFSKSHTVNQFMFSLCSCSDRDLENKENRDVVRSPLLPTHDRNLNFLKHSAASMVKQFKLYSAASELASSVSEVVVQLSLKRKKK